MLVFGLHATCLSVCSVLHTNVHYAIAEKKKIPDLLCLQEVPIQTYSVFVRYEYL